MGVATAMLRRFCRRAPEHEFVAVILAAGSGSRLGSGVKCLVEVGGRSLLEHQFRALEEAGVNTVVVVAGHQVERVRRAVGGRADVIVNDRYAETNSVYSFMLARESVDGSALVLNADVLFHPEVIRRLLDVDGSALAFDSSADLDDETMKVEVYDEHLVRMSKTLEPVVQSGENLGILKLDGSAALAAFALVTLAEEIASGRLRLEAGAQPDDVIAQLVALPGIGRWTAQYIAMRALRWPDAFPKEDVALRKNLGGVTAARAEELSEAWRPWRSYATLHLWQRMVGEGQARVK